jgi:nitrogen regulatory protein P-II 1
MNKIEAIIQPDKLEEVKEALLKEGVDEITVTHAQGFGRQKGQTLLYRGAKYTAQFLNKIKIETVVSDEMTEAAVAVIVQAARNGNIGDGKIFVIPMGQIVHIRGEEQNRVAPLAISAVG